ncbi:hypothetical protein Tco_0284699, partial [Tanacetum coccineum]
VVAKHDVSPSVIDEPVVNGEGDSENARQTCANSASDGVVPISTPIPGKSSSYANVTGVEPSIEVSNCNPFEVLNSVDNDVELVLVLLLLLIKIEKFEDLLSYGQAILVDDAGNPLKKVQFLGDCDSEDEVASVDNDMARSLASERVGFGT